MNQRLWTGLLVGLLSAMALVAVGVGAFHAGERHSEPVAAVVPGATAAGGEIVPVVDYGHWRGGPAFGFLFPLLDEPKIVDVVRSTWSTPASRYVPPGTARPPWNGPGRSLPT